MFGSAVKKARAVTSQSESRQKLNLATERSHLAVQRALKLGGSQLLQSVRAKQSEMAEQQKGRCSSAVPLSVHR